MDRRTKIILGGAAALAAGAGLVIAYRNEGEIGETVRAAAHRAAEAVVATAKEAVKVAREITGSGIPSSVISNFQRYGLAQIIEDYRGPIPWALAAATVELESGGDPYIYNFYDGPQTTYTDKTGVKWVTSYKGNRAIGHWTPGTPLPDNSWANGLLQILTKYLDSYGLSKADAFDPAKNAKAALKVLQKQWSRAKAAPTDDLRWALFYVGQNRGGGNDQSPGLLQALAKVAAGGIADIIAAAGIPAAVGRVAGRVAARVPLWQAVEAQLKGQGGAVGAALAGLAVDQDYRDWTDVPIFQHGMRIGYARARMHRWT